MGILRDEIPARGMSRPPANRAVHGSAKGGGPDRSAARPAPSGPPLPGLGTVRQRNGTCIRERRVAGKVPLSARRSGSESSGSPVGDDAAGVETLRGFVGSVGLILTWSTQAWTRARLPPKDRASKRCRMSPSILANSAAAAPD